MFWHHSGAAFWKVERASRLSNCGQRPTLPPPSTLCLLNSFFKQVASLLLCLCGIFLGSFDHKGTIFDPPTHPSIPRSSHGHQRRPSRETLSPARVHCRSGQNTCWHVLRFPIIFDRTSTRLSRYQMWANSLHFLGRRLTVYSCHC